MSFLPAGMTAEREPSDAAGSKIEGRWSLVNQRESDNADCKTAFDLDVQYELPRSSLDSNAGCRQRRRWLTSGENLNHRHQNKVRATRAGWKKWVMILTDASNRIRA